MPGFPVLLYPSISWSLLKLMSMELVTSFNHLASGAPSPPALSLSQHQGVFQWVSSLHQVAEVLGIQLQHQSFQWIFRTDFLWDWLGWSPCCPRDSQKSSPTPQFKSNNSSVFSFHYSPTLTSIHDYWKCHSFDCMDLCQQSEILQRSFSNKNICQRHTNSYQILG